MNGLRRLTPYMTEPSKKPVMTEAKLVMVSTCYFGGQDMYL